MGGDGMQRSKNLIYEDLEEAIKLSINEKLFQKGYISAEMYTRAKLMIIKRETGTYDKLTSKVS